jgi:hypothetical protein
MAVSSVAVRLCLYKVFAGRDRLGLQSLTSVGYKIENHAAHPSVSINWSAKSPWPSMR